MRFASYVLILLAAVSAPFLNARAAQAASVKEDHVKAPMPPGFQVIVNELEGPVFADAQGRTLYKWPKWRLRNGDSGEIPLKPTCDNHVYRETSGFVTPYPAGLEMPDADNRPSCADLWPPVLASADAKPVGKWVIVDRLDGRKQWAYDGLALYTSILDKRPGDVLGGSTMLLTPGGFADSGAPRVPVGPDANLPAQFKVTTSLTGRLVTTNDGWSVYTFEGDSRNKSNCYDECLDSWEPILAATYGRPVGEWTIFERSPDIRQWAFRGMPVYRYLEDHRKNSQAGSDIVRWRNVYTQLAPKPPKGFVLKDTLTGLLLGDARGMTVYTYNCTDDAADQLACDHPDSPQEYRFAMCGGGDPDTCVKTFPYVLAPAGAQSGNQIWSTIYIDPKTGKKATANQPGALHVWAFRDRPIYTFAGRSGYGDETPEDFRANSWGEYFGKRNGFRVFTYRDAS